MHWVASVYNPHSNQLAEGAVKAAKRMLRDNTGTQGTLDPNKFLAALLAHRKPDPETTISSSDILFWRRIKDLMLKQQEVVITRRHLTGGKELNKHTRELGNSR